ncbi:hypothetical protein OS11_27940 [Dickeya oryzae]
MQATGVQSGTLPSVWAALGNSLLFATGHTVLVTVLAVPAAYALSRLGFRRREGVLKALLLLHAFPVMALTVAIFYSALLDGAAQQSVGGDAGDVRP